MIYLYIHTYIWHVHILHINYQASFAFLGGPKNSFSKLRPTRSWHSLRCPDFGTTTPSGPPSEFFFDRGPKPQGPRDKATCPTISHPRWFTPTHDSDSGIPKHKVMFFFWGGLLWYVLGKMLEMFQRWIATKLATQNHVISKIVCVKAAFWL